MMRALYKKHPPLNWPEFLYLFGICNNPDESPLKRDKAREELILSNMGLVMRRLGKYEETGIPIEDLLQVGYFPLAIALKKFNPGKGYTFSTYADFWIRQQFLNEIDEIGGLIRISHKTMEKYWAICRSRERLGISDKECPLSEESASKIREDLIATNLRLRTTYIIETDQLFRMKSWTSIDAEVDGLSLGGKLKSNDGLESRVGRESFMEQWLSVLEPDEREAVMRRYGINGHHEHMMKDIPASMGIGTKRLKALMKSALEKLGNAFQDCKPVYQLFFG